jgi:hypothetical protein
VSTPRAAGIEQRQIVADAAEFAAAVGETLGAAGPSESAVLNATVAAFVAEQSRS